MELKNSPSNTFLFDKKSYVIFALISVLGHMAFIFSQIEAFNTLSSHESQEPRRKVINVKLNSKRSRQIVDSKEESKRKLQSTDSYLGKVDNQVLRETQAKQVSSFNEAGVGQKDGQKSSISKKIENKKVKKISLTDLGTQPEKNLRELKEELEKERIAETSLPAQGLENGVLGKKGLSSSNDYLEEVELGDFTKLNTQEYEFYGFYHRIKQKLEQFWGRNLQEQMRKVLKAGRHIASEQSLLTALTIQLNARGEIVKIQVDSTSGIKELDTVAIDSFNEAGPFPNPPQKMLKNGRATIKWGFAVETR